MKPAHLSPTLLANTLCSLSDRDLDSSLVPLLDNGDHQQLNDDNRDQSRLEPAQRTAPVEISRGSPATSIYLTSIETASSNDSGLCTDSDESLSFLEDEHSHLVVLHSKHKLLVDLMREVYAIFDQRWTANIQAHAGSSPSVTPPLNQNPTQNSSCKGKKRCREDRDSTPPNDGGSRKKPSPETSSNTEKQKDSFACPFHKHDPAKYRCSVDDGSKYRACGGPGFPSIARLK